MELKENIAETIIKRYQEEDLLRAYNLDLEKFGNQVINFFPISPKEKLAKVNYYEDLISKMKEEGIEASGHLKETNDLVAAMSQLHQTLKRDDKKYFAVYESTLPFIEHNLQHAEGVVSDEIQICLNGVYGFLLLKINQREIEVDEQKMVDVFGNLLSQLSFKFEESKKLN